MACVSAPKMNQQEELALTLPLSLREREIRPRRAISSRAKPGWPLAHRHVSLAAIGRSMQPPPRNRRGEAPFVPRTVPVSFRESSAARRPSHRPGAPKRVRPGGPSPAQRVMGLAARTGCETACFAPHHRRNKFLMEAQRPGHFRPGRWLDSLQPKPRAGCPRYRTSPGCDRQHRDPPGW